MLNESEFSFFRDKLPREIKKEIFKFLNIGDLIQAGRVCKEWREIVDGLGLSRRALDALPSIAFFLKNVQDNLLPNTTSDKELLKTTGQVTRLLKFSPLANSLIFDYFFTFVVLVT